MTLNVAVIGTGRIGRVHAANLTHQIPRARLKAVADVDEDSAHRCAAELAAPASYADYRRVLEDPDVQAIVICTSTDAHAQIAEDAADAGKHVFCEKPVSLDLAVTDRVLRAVDRGGIKFQVGFNRRFDPSFRRVREAVQNGQVGEPHLIHVTSRDPAPPPLEYIRRSGGIFLDMTIHDFDMMRYLSGQEVVEIYAAGSVMVDEAIGRAGDLDTALITLKMDGGTLGTIDNSRKAVYGYDQRVEVFGSGGSIRTENHHPNAAVLSTAAGILRDLPLHFFIERYAESFVEEMLAFVRSVLDDEPVQVTGRDGRIPVLMALAAARSVSENRPIQLAEMESPSVQSGSYF